MGVRNSQKWAAWGVAMLAIGCSSNSTAENFGKGTPLNISGTTFLPTTLEIKKGKEVQIDIANSTNLEHNFTVKDENIASDLATGSKHTFKVKFDKAGTYEYYCRLHRSGGMNGFFVVS